MSLEGEIYEALRSHLRFELSAFDVAGNVELTDDLTICIQADSEDVKCISFNAFIKEGVAVMQCHEDDNKVAALLLACAKNMVTIAESLGAKQ